MNSNPNIWTGTSDKKIWTGISEVYLPQWAKDYSERSKNTINMETAKTTKD